MAWVWIRSPVVVCACPVVMWLLCDVLLYPTPRALCLLCAFLMCPVYVSLGSAALLSLRALFNFFVCCCVLRTPAISSAISVLLLLARTQPVPCLLRAAWLGGRLNWTSSFGYIVTSM